MPNEKKVRLYKVTVIDKPNGPIATEYVPGDSKTQVKNDNTYPHCVTEVEFEGFATVAVEPTDPSIPYGDLSYNVTMSKGEIISFSSESSEGKNQISHEIHSKGHDYLKKHTANLEEKLKKDLNKYVMED